MNWYSSIDIIIVRAGMLFVLAVLAGMDVISGFRRAGSDTCRFTQLSVRAGIPVEFLIRAWFLMCSLVADSFDFGRGLSVQGQSSLLLDISHGLILCCRLSLRLRLLELEVFKLPLATARQSSTLLRQNEPSLFCRLKDC